MSTVVAVIGFTYTKHCNPFGNFLACVYEHGGASYKPLLWLGWVGVVVAVPAWLTTVVKYPLPREH